MRVQPQTNPRMRKKIVFEMLDPHRFFEVFGKKSFFLKYRTHRDGKNFAPQGVVLIQPVFVSCSCTWSIRKHSHTMSSYHIPNIVCRHRVVRSVCAVGNIPYVDHPALSSYHVTVRHLRMYVYQHAVRRSSFTVIMPCVCTPFMYYFIHVTDRGLSRMHV